MAKIDYPDDPNKIIKIKDNINTSMSPNPSYWTIEITSASYVYIIPNDEPVISSSYIGPSYISAPKLEE